jgi:tetratricopeptide (TPR) repeat protein
LELIATRLSFDHEDALTAIGRGTDSLFAKALQDLSDLWPLRRGRVRDAAHALNDGRVDEANRAIAKVLFKHPRDADALNLMAQICLHAGDNAGAELLLARCVQGSPHNEAYRYNYALVLSLLGKVDEALAETKALLEKCAGNLLFRNLCAALLCRKRHFADASACYRGLTKDYPDSPELWCRLGSTLRSLGGHAQEAVDAFRKAVELAPWMGSVWWCLASMKTFGFSESDISVMESQLGDAPASTEHRAEMHYALGKAYEDLKSYEKSFQHYSRGNALRRVDLTYDPDETTAMVSRAKTVFKQELFGEKCGVGHDSVEPIFVLGLQRAGSTLVEQILSSHSQIEAAGELQSILRVVAEDVMPKTGPDYPSGMENLADDDLRNMGERYLQLSRPYRMLNRPFFVDKCPFNLWHVGLIHLILPSAKIIDVRRHPIGCCYANFTMSFGHAPPLSYRLTDIGLFYRDYVRLMAHFDRVLPGNIHRIFYEQLVADLEGAVRRLLDFLGLPFESACLEYYKNDRAFNSFSNEQVRRPIFEHAVDRWRNYERWLGPLKTSLGSVLEAYPGVPEFDG